MVRIIAKTISALAVISFAAINGRDDARGVMQRHDDAAGGCRRCPGGAICYARAMINAGTEVLNMPNTKIPKLIQSADSSQ